MTLTREQIEEWRGMLICPLPWASEKQRLQAINELADMALQSLKAPALTMPHEPKYYDNDGYICENGVKPKFVLKSDYDALRQSLAEANARVEGLERKLHETKKPYYLRVGKYSIGNHPAGGYWLEHESGEGMQSGERFEEAVHEFYKQSF